jgi:hypothetical protein
MVIPFICFCIGDQAIQLERLRKLIGKSPRDPLRAISARSSNRRVRRQKRKRKRVDNPRQIAALRAQKAE